MKFVTLHFNLVSASEKIKIDEDIAIKGGGFNDKLGADAGTKNPKKSALAIFIFI